MGEFLRIVEHIDEIPFEGCKDANDLALYKDAVKNMFIRLDAYYEKMVFMKKHLQQKG